MAFAHDAPQLSAPVSDRALQDAMWYSELYLDLDDAQALAAMGLPDDGSNRSESFLDARRGAMWLQIQPRHTPQPGSASESLSPGPASESLSRDLAGEALIVAASCPSEGQPSGRTCTTDENIESRSYVAWHRIANKLILREKTDYDTLWSNPRRNSRTAITHLQSGGTLSEYRVMMMQRSACQKTREVAEGMMTRKGASSTACEPSAPPKSSSAAHSGSPESPH